MSVLTNLPDPGSYKTPDTTAALHTFKSKLFAGEVGTPSGSLAGVVITQPARNWTAEEEAAIAEYNESIGDEGAEDTTYATPTIASTMRASNQSETFPTPLHAVVRYLESIPSREDVVITASLGKITFKALNVSITDYGVAFIVKKDAMQFEPHINATLKFTYKGQDYDVVYAGGFFTFDKMPFTFVSFLRVTEQ